MPYGASRQKINHDFFKSPYHFILDKSNFFVMRQGEKFPKKFKLKVTLSQSDKVLYNSNESFSDIKYDVKLGETGISFEITEVVNKT